MSPTRLRLSAALLTAVAALVLVVREHRSPAPLSESKPPISAATAESLSPAAKPIAAAASPASTPPAPDRERIADIRATAQAQADAFTEWLTAWRRADSSTQPTLIARGHELAAARRAALKPLLAADPQLALELAVPVGLRGELPAEIVAQLERRIDHRGMLEATVGCYGPITRIDRTALIAGETFAAHVYGRRAEQHTKFGLPLHGIAIDNQLAISESPFRLLDDMEKVARQFSTDAAVVAVGEEIKVLSTPAELDALTAALIADESRVGPHLATANDTGPASSATPPTAATTPWILGAKRVLWVKVDFADDQGSPANDEDIRATNTQVSAFYAANSQGKTTMTFNILPATLRLPRDKAVYNASSTTVAQLQSDAAVLAKAYDAANGGTGAYDPDRYDRWIVLFRRMPAYTFGGQAQLTGPQVRMNGGISPGTTAHELGHTQGLSHSHYWLPSGTSGVGAGAHVEYGDVFDAMGSSGSSPNNHFNAPQKTKLGYLEESAITTVTQSGTYRIARHDHADATGVRAIKVSADLGYDYWIEHRQFGPTAFNTAQLDRLRNGILLHWGQGRAPRFTTGAGSYLVDATAGSAGDANDAPLRIGETFIDPDAGLTITPLSVGGTAPAEFIEVRVAFGATGTNRNPTLAAEPPAGVLAARSNIIFNASAADPDGDSVYYRWDFGDGQLNPNLSNITRRFAKGGTYTLRVSAHDGKGGIASRTIPLTIADPLVSWTSRTSGVMTTAFNDILFAGGRFIAVGDAGIIATSTDGTAWSRTTINNTYGLRSIAHNGARYVAVALRVGSGNERGGAAYSDDGDTWTLATTPAGTGQMLAVAYGAGRFVGVGENGRIYTSPDGASWAETNSGVSGASAHLRSIVYAQDRFLVGGDSGRILFSTDGLTWTNRSLPTTASSTSVAYHRGRWHAINGTLNAYTSADGVTWTRSIAVTGTTNLPVVRARVLGDLLMSGSISGNVLFGETVETWAAHQLDGTANTSINAVAAGNGVLVAVGSRGLIFTTTQPAAATVPPLSPPSLRNEADSIKVAVGKKNVIAATGTGFTKLELYANGTKVDEINATSGALSFTPRTIGNYSLVVRGVEASGTSIVSAAVPAISGFANWIPTNLKPVSADLRGAVRVGNKWWVVGAVGSFFTVDSDGTITPVDFPTTQNLTAIAYAGGRFIATGPYLDAGAREEIGSIWTSTDGYAWTPLLTTVFDNFNINFVTHAQDKWLVGTTGGLILTSLDGLNWTRQLSGVTTGLRRGAFGNNTWILVGNSGRVLTSPDGVTWTSRDSGITTDLVSIAFHDGTFVACGSAGVILSSADGVTWTRQNSGVTGVLNSIANIRNTWVVVGDTAGVRTSTDLRTWTPASLDGNTVTSLFVAGSGDNGILLTQRGQIFTTNNPTTWRRLTSGANDSRLGVVYAKDRFVAVGASIDVIRSTSIPSIQNSTDGLTWTRASAGGTLPALNAVTFGQDLFVAVGANSAIFTSPDGANWTQRTLNITATLTTVTAGPNAFVAASSGQAIYSSTDGTAWSQRLNSVGVALRGSAYGAGRFVVVGDSGHIRHSPDGVGWTTATSGVTANLLTVAYFEGVGFLAAGNSGTMLNSLDGITWTPVETGISDNIAAVAQTPIGFVAAGGTNGTLLVSLDGANWSIATVPADRTIRGIAANNRTIVAIGDNGTSLAFEIVDSTPAPTISTQPLALSVAPGATATFTVDAQNARGGVFQWFKDGSAIPGATTPTFFVSTVAAPSLGNYTVSVTTSTGTVTSRPATLSLASLADPGRLINLSIRTDLNSASDTFTFGVVIGGANTSGSKALVVRAAGPSLAAFGVPGVLDDPKLEFYTGTAKVGENDNWGGSDALRNVISQVGAFPFSAPNSRDAAISFPSLASGANSAKISGAGTGTVLAELYDATPGSQFTASTPRLINVSVLKHLGTGVTAGFVIGGSSARTVLIRAIGPTLTGFGITDAVADPQLALFSGSSQIGANDNWAGTTTLSGAFVQVGAFSLAPASRDAALLVTLQPGSYTVQVSGVGGTTGSALVEVYEVP